MHADDVGDALRQPSPAASLPAPAASLTPVASITPAATATPSATASPAPATAAPQPAASVDCSTLKCVALTFDDGPSNLTAGILDTLDAAGVKATFFELGPSAKAYPAIVRRQQADGMAIGSHSVRHQEFTKLTRAQQVAEAKGGADRIAAAGVPRPTLFRPPYGAYDANTRTLGVPIILWDVDSLDWKNKDAAATTALVLQGVRPGSIVLMHDIWPSTAQALPGIIARLKADGYTLVTVPQLLGDPTPGKVYSRLRG